MSVAALWVLKLGIYGARYVAHAVEAEKTQRKLETVQQLTTGEQVSPSPNPDGLTLSDGRPGILIMENGRVRLVPIAPNEPERSRQQKLHAKFAQLTKQAERRAYAQLTQEALWRSGVECKVWTKGANDTTLYFEYILIGNSFRFKFGEEFIGPKAAELREIGFSKVEITDGYDHAWEWTL